MRVGLGTVLGGLYLFVVFAPVFVTAGGYTRVTSVQAPWHHRRVEQEVEVPPTEERRRLRRRVADYVERSGDPALKRKWATATFVQRFTVLYHLGLGLGCLLVPFVRSHTARLAAVFLGSGVLIAPGVVSVTAGLATRSVMPALVGVGLLLVGTGCLLLRPVARRAAVAIGWYGLAATVVMALALKELDVRHAVEGVPGWVASLGVCQRILQPILLIWFFSLGWVREQFRSGLGTFSWEL